MTVGEGDVAWIGAEDCRAGPRVEWVERHRLEGVLGQDAVDADRRPAITGCDRASGDVGDHARVQLDAFAARPGLEARQGREADGVLVVETSGAQRDPAPAGLAPLRAVGPPATNVSLLEKRAGRAHPRPVERRRDEPFLDAIRQVVLLPLQPGAAIEDQHVVGSVCPDTAAVTGHLAQEHRDAAKQMLQEPLELVGILHAEQHVQVVRHELVIVDGDREQVLRAPDDPLDPPVQLGPGDEQHPPELDPPRHLDDRSPRNEPRRVAHRARTSHASCHTSSPEDHTHTVRPADTRRPTHGRSRPPAGRFSRVLKMPEGIRPRARGLRRRG